MVSVTVAGNVGDFVACETKLNNVLLPVQFLIRVSCFGVD